MKKIVILNTHPVYYHIPIYRALANNPDYKFSVWFSWNPNAASHKERDPNWKMTYENELLKGYKFSSLKPWPFGYRDSFFGTFNPSVVKKILSPHSRPDALIIFGHDRLTNWLALILCRIASVPVLFKGEADLLTQKSRVRTAAKWILLRFFYANVAAAVFSYKKNQDFFVNYGLRPEQLFFAPCAIDDDKFWTNSSHKQEMLRQQVAKLAHSSIEFLFVGRLDARKQIDVLIAAFEICCAQFDQIRLTIIGSGENEQVISKLIAKSSYAYRIKLLGFQPKSKIFEAFKTSQVLVLPSIKDPSPKVVNEAMVHGLPVIVSDKVGLANDMVLDNYNGYIFEAGNVKALASSMSSYINNENKITLSANALDTAFKWSMKNNINGLEDCLTQMLKSR